MASFEHPSYFQPDEIELLQRAFDPTWETVKAYNPFRDRAKDEDLRRAIGAKICTIAVTGVTDPEELRVKALASIELPYHKPLRGNGSGAE